MNIEEIKNAYRISAAWRDLGLPGKPGKVCRSPFPSEHQHGDANPSFSVTNEGRRWHNFATGEGGSVVDLVMKVLGCGIAEAIQWIKERLGIPRSAPKAEQSSVQRPEIPPLHGGTEEELRTLANQRGFSVEGLRLAQSRGFLHFTEFLGLPAWCVTDERRALVEFRRLDGFHWPVCGDLKERKSHCRGRGKNFPLGMFEAARFEKIVICEGSPDFLAAHHFAFIEGKAEAIGITCVLGASNHRLAPEALTGFKGKRVCLYPHLDSHGQRAVQIWARQIKEAGAVSVTAFDLRGIVKVNGGQGNDLADAALISADAFELNPKWMEILP